MTDSCLNSDGLSVFFCAKIILKEQEGACFMKNEILDMFFSNPKIWSIPLGCQSTAMQVFEEVLDTYRKENPHATISELFRNDESAYTE